MTTQLWHPTTTKVFHGIFNDCEVKVIYSTDGYTYALDYPNLMQYTDALIILDKNNWDPENNPLLFDC